MRRLLFLAPALAFVLIIAGFALGLNRDPSLLPSTLIDKPLPRFDLPAVRPGDAGLASGQFSQGQGPRLLNVFASWCVSCRAEHPLLMSLHAQGAPIDGLDWKDRAADGARFLAQQGDPYQRVGNDESGRTGIDLGVSGAPETFVVDRAGRVRLKIVGPLTRQDWDQRIAPLLQRLAAG